MEKLCELTIKDVKELTEGKKVKVQMVCAMSVQTTDAIIIAETDSGEDGTITILMPDTGFTIKLDSGNMIESIHGNENMIAITFPKNMGSLDIIITDDNESETDHVINQEELCQYIKDRLDRLSKLTIEDIDLILNAEMEFLKDKGIAD